MYHGQDKNLVGFHQIDYAVVLKNQFPYVVAFGFGYLAPHERFLVQQVYCIDDPVYKLFGIYRYVSRDIRINIAQIQFGGFRLFDPHACFWCLAITRALT